MGTFVYVHSCGNDPAARRPALRWPERERRRPGRRLRLESRSRESAVVFLSRLKRPATERSMSLRKADSAAHVVMNVSRTSRRKRIADAQSSLLKIEEQVVACTRCPRLIEHCSTVGATKRRAFRDHDYWARPVPSFGDRSGRLLIVGLAPAAHGANRTGRMFTGDRSGQWLYRALHRAGVANLPQSSHRGDALALQGAYITAAAHCAPPQNRPLPDELANCSHYLEQEMAVMRGLATQRGNRWIVIALGGIAFRACLQSLAAVGNRDPTPSSALRALCRGLIGP